YSYLGGAINGQIFHLSKHSACVWHWYSYSDNASVRYEGNEKMKNKKRFTIILVCTFSSLLLFFRLFCGIFVIQPLGAIPNGATIIYWRSGLNIPFVASADGLLDNAGAGVSLLGRGLMLAKLAEPIKEREIIRFGYSETLYLWSTGGKQYEK
ncbi:MAG: hypothetical protein ABSG55_11120, partial [Dehalococcoidia bacterium]